MNVPVQYFPAQAPVRPLALIIFPGGGYSILAPHEGAGYAERFAREGIDCHVVSYPVAPDGHRHPAMIAAAQQAIAGVRAHLAPGVRLGVMGSSAGGHLAAHTLVEWERTHPLHRPDFGVLCYPVISMRSTYGHTGSRLNLLGPDPAEESVADLSMESRVTARTPPCFLWHTVEDATVAVEHSLLFGAALRKAGVEFELHAYSRGRHGLGLDTSFDWSRECLRWMIALE